MSSYIRVWGGLYFETRILEHSNSPMIVVVNCHAFSRKCIAKTSKIDNVCVCISSNACINNSHTKCRLVSAALTLILTIVGHGIVHDTKTLSYKTKFKTKFLSFLSSLLFVYTTKFVFVQCLWYGVCIWFTIYWVISSLVAQCLGNAWSMHWFGIECVVEAFSRRVCLRNQPSYIK